jgi:hypothetical protein
MVEKYLMRLDPARALPLRKWMVEKCLMRLDPACALPANQRLSLHAREPQVRLEQRALNWSSL